MNVTHEVKDGLGIARFSGRLDLFTANEAKQQLLNQISTGQRHLIVDLGGVTFVDSSGLGMLIGVLKAARLAGGNVCVARSNDQARLIMRLTGLDRVMQLYATVEEAVADFK